MSETEPQKYSQMIFDKGAKAIEWIKEQSFQQMVLEQLDIHTGGNKTTVWEKILGRNTTAKGVSDKELSSKTKKEFKLSDKEMNNPTKKWAKDLTGTRAKKTYRSKISILKDALNHTLLVSYKLK